MLAFPWLQDVNVSDPLIGIGPHSPQEPPEARGDGLDRSSIEEIETVFECTLNAKRLSLRA